MATGCCSPPDNSWGYWRNSAPGRECRPRAPTPSPAPVTRRPPWVASNRPAASPDGREMLEYGWFRPRRSKGVSDCVAPIVTVHWCRERRRRGLARRLWPVGLGRLPRSGSRQRSARGWRGCVGAGRHVGALNRSSRLSRRCAHRGVQGQRASRRATRWHRLRDTPASMRSATMANADWEQTPNRLVMRSPHDDQAGANCRSVELLVGQRGEHREQLLVVYCNGHGCRSDLRFGSAVLGLRHLIRGARCGQPRRRDGQLRVG